VSRRTYGEGIDEEELGAGRHEGAGRFSGLQCNQRWVVSARARDVEDLEEEGAQGGRRKLTSDPSEQQLGELRTRLWRYRAASVAPGAIAPMLLVYLGRGAGTIDLDWSSKQA